MNINWLGGLFILFSQFGGKGKEKQESEDRSQETEGKAESRIQESEFRMKRRRTASVFILDSEFRLLHSAFSMIAQVILYTRPGCHLCEEAKAEMLAAGCSDEYVLAEVNIESDPVLEEKYGWEIPVIVINGVKAFKYRLTADEFKRKLCRLAQ
jgi:glutaredoxin